MNSARTKPSIVAGRRCCWRGSPTGCKPNAWRREKDTFSPNCVPSLSGEAEEPYEAVARRLKIPRATLKVLVHRFRRRYEQLLREEIVPTVASPEEVEDEIRALFAALS